MHIRNEALLLTFIITNNVFCDFDTATSTQGKADSKALKEMAVPNEVVQTVEDFK